MQEKWYYKTWFIILLLIVFAPAGLILMWIGGKFNKYARIGITAVVLLFIVMIVVSDKKTDVSRQENNKVSTQESRVTASAAAKQLITGDVWLARGEESFVKVVVQKPDQVAISAGNPFLQIKEQTCKLNISDTVLNCAVSDTKGSDVKVQLEYKENKLVATLTKAQERAWGPIGLSKNPQSNSTTATKQPAIPAAKWNIKELNAIENGNIPIAVKQIKAIGDTMRLAIAADVEDVAKAPWTYYGKIVRFRGEVGFVQEYPPGSSTAKTLGGAASELALIVSDRAIVGFFFMGSARNINKGDMVTIYGFPVGLVDAQNPMGGISSRLLIVGNGIGN
jgi:uncharacterized membrane protein